MKKPGTILGITLTLGILLAMFLAKIVVDALLTGVIVIGLALLIGIFWEYLKFMRK